MKRKLEILKSVEIILAVLLKFLASFFESKFLLYASFIGGLVAILTELIYFSLYKQIYVYGKYLRGKMAYFGVLFWGGY